MALETQGLATTAEYNVLSSESVVHQSGASSEGQQTTQEGLSLLLAMILKALGPHQYYASDDEYAPDRVPLLRNAVVVGDPVYGSNRDAWNIKINDKHPASTMAIRKRLRAINESRAQKRKAGQVYDMPLSGSQLTKPGIFPEQRPCGEDFKKKWIEGAVALEDALSKGLPIQTEIDALRSYLDGGDKDPIFDLVLSSLPEETRKNGTDTLLQLNHKGVQVRGKNIKKWKTQEARGISSTKNH